MSRAALVVRAVTTALLLVGLARGAGAEDVATSTADVVRTARAYRSALERVLEFRERDVERAVRTVAARREMLDHGIVARRDVDDAERGLAEARAAADETRREIARTENLVVEAEAADQQARDRSARSDDRARATVAAIPPGMANGRWSLAEAPAVEAFFEAEFGRPLPVSAFGQTALHDRFGFDHRNALDVAVTPDSAEGRALIAYLTAHHVPFLAFRGPRPGIATGAHIHIGAPSHHRG